MLGMYRQFISELNHKLLKMVFIFLIFSGEDYVEKYQEN